MKNTFRKSLAIAGLAAGSFIAANAAYASPLTVDGYPVEPMIGADTSNDYGDGGAPFVAAGDFTGVVSINIRRPEGSFICTGSAISRRHIITAAHCVDNDDGSVMDLTTGDVRAVFADGGAFNDIITASAVDIHPDYIGFGVCGPTDGTGLAGACLNDDIAILTLENHIPAYVETYDFFEGTLDAGDLLTMVGHGTTGNGLDGFSPGSADFFNKRFGFNVIDGFDCDDTNNAPESGGWGTSAACPAAYGNEAEVWYADFDGVDANGAPVDFFCGFAGWGCGTELGTDTTAGLFEAIIGGGDSGGPSFVYDSVNDKFLLAANNTFGIGTSPIASGGFGAVFGGNLYTPYLDWIDSFARTAVNAPATITLFFGGLFVMAMRRRRKQ